MTAKLEIIAGIPTEKSGTYVGWDSSEVSQSSLWTDGIGSCVAIAMYDSERKLGALAHIMGVRDLAPEAMYPENIVHTLVSQFGEYRTLEIALVGEESPAHLNQEKMSDIIRKKVSFFQIPIIGEDLGDFESYRGREVHFDCKTGKINVYRLSPLF